MHEPASPHASERCVFVYGTLRRGGANDITRLHPAPRWVGPAVVPGRLYHLGAYPGIRLDELGQVHGEVYRITPALEAVLDRIEEIGPSPEDEYVKRAVTVQVGDVRLHCLVYEVQAWRCRDAVQIASGDWMQR